MAKNTPGATGDRDLLFSYIAGFGLSIILTMAAYLSVTRHSYSDSILLDVIIGLGVLQFVAQLLFFLHLGREAKQRLSEVVLLFMILVVAVLVIGSLWIMANLDYQHNHAVNPLQQDKYLIHDEGVDR